MLKRKVKVKTLKLKLITDVRHFSVWQMLVFCIVFAGIGFLVFRSFADTSWTVVASDNFNRADSNPISGNWMSQPGVAPMQIINNQLTTTDNTQAPNYDTVTDNFSIWRDIMPADLDAEITVTSFSSEHEPFEIFLLDQNLNVQVDLFIYPLDVVKKSTIYLGGVTSPITDYPYFPVSAGDRIGLRVMGTTVDVMQNGNVVYERTIPSSSVNSRLVEIGSHIEVFNPGGGLFLDDFSVSTPNASFPTAPSNLAVTSSTYKQVNLSWDASTETGGNVAGYNIFRNGVKIDSSTTNSYSDNTVADSSSYSYQVQAYDAQGNTSPLSNAASVTTPAAPPSAPTGLLGKTASDTEVNLSWKASTSSIGISSYKIYETVTQAPDVLVGDTNTPPAILIGSANGTAYQATGLQPNTSYSFYVVATDTAGTDSQPSDPASAITTGAVTPCVSSQTNRCLSGTAWQYLSPFGDKDCSSSSGLSCRPMTMQTCTDGQSQETTRTLISSALDQGVDYGVQYVVPGCTYDNPDPADIGTSTSSINSKTNTRYYAMGAGKIICVAGNKGYGENPNLPTSCPGNSNAFLGPGDGTWLVYQLTSGPAKGLDIYIAEGCTMSNNAISDAVTGKTLGRRWSDGRLVINGKKIPADKVTANSVLCEVSPGTIETGWANSALPVEPAASDCQWKVLKLHVPTVWGHSTNEFIEKAGGPSGLRDSYINGVLKFDPVYHSCSQYPMDPKFANPAWYDPNSV